DGGLLTHDHSWINEVVDAGEMSEEEAILSRRAHEITHCLGRLETENPTDPVDPPVISFTLPEQARLLLCSDGLWNYATSAKEVIELVRESPADSDALACCRRLVEFALSHGGKDNVTVAMLSL